MKVLTIINSANMGGIEKTLISCLKNMKDEELKMSIACFKKGGVLEEEFKDLGVEFHYIKKTGSIIIDMVQLYYLIIAYNFDVIHSRFGFTSGGFVLATKLTNRKSIVSVHSNSPSTFQSFQKIPLLNKALSIHLKIHKLLTLRYAKKIIGHSRSNLELNFNNWESNSKFGIVYNGVDFKAFGRERLTSNNLDDFIKDSFIILHIGSFRKPKNHTFLIDCFHSLLPRENNYKLVLVGSGELLESAKEKVKVLGISDLVYFAGFDMDTSKYFDKADLFFLPSLNEGLANVLIEAQYKKIPICVSDIPPLYESGYRDYHKYYFNPNDQKDTINQLKNIIEDIKNERLEETKMQARKYVIEKFSIETMVEKLSELYKFKK